MSIRWGGYCSNCGAVEIIQKKKPARCKVSLKISERCWRQCGNALAGVGQIRTSDVDNDSWKEVLNKKP